MTFLLKRLSSPTSPSPDQNHALYRLVQSWLTHPTAKDPKTAKIVIGLTLEASPNPAAKQWLSGLSVESIADRVVEQYKDILTNDRQWFLTIFKKSAYENIRHDLEAGRFTEALAKYASIKKLPLLCPPEATATKGAASSPQKRARIQDSDAQPAPIAPPAVATAPNEATINARVASFMAQHPLRSLSSLGLTPEQALAQLQQRQAMIMGMLF